MADSKLTALSTVTTAPRSTDYIYLVKDPSGSPTSHAQDQRRFMMGYGHNVLNYGAVGDGATDDTTAIQAAINAAMGFGGDALVIFPGRRSYKISSTLVLPSPSSDAGGLELVGLSGSSASNFGEPPKIEWFGSAGGTMLDINASGNLVGFGCKNLLWAGRGTNDPAKLIRLRGAKLDSGTFIRDCWFRSCNGDAISIEVGATNFTIQGGRFDAIYGGYGIHAVTGSFVNMTILGNLTYVGGASVNGKGFLFLDGESAGYAHCTINGLHTEVNQDLVESYASGANPSDKQGLIRLGVAPPSQYVQHTLEIMGWENSSQTGVKSYSAIQITSSSGTAADAAACANVSILGASGLNNFNASDAGATNEIRMFGGNIPSDQHWPFLGYRHGLVLWGRGQNSSYEGVRHFLNSNGFRVHGLEVQPESGTDAPAIYSGTGAPAFSAKKGSLYLRSDGTGTNNCLYVNTSGSTTWTAK